jgi:hypothetical protein
MGLFQWILTLSATNAGSDFIVSHASLFFNVSSAIVRLHHPLV